jgi:hypothetical protein
MHGVRLHIYVFAVGIAAVTAVEIYKFICYT